MVSMNGDQQSSNSPAAEPTPRPSSSGWLRWAGLALILAAATRSLWNARNDGGLASKSDAPAALAGATDCTSIPAAAGSCRGKNVFLITLGTTRIDRLGAYGSGAGLTPELDAFARDGVTFAGAHATAPLSLPAHASILTGRYPVHHGARASGFFRLPAEGGTLAETLSAAGYQSHAIVSSLLVTDQLSGLGRGFTSLDDHISYAPSAESILSAVRTADQMTERATTWLAAHQDKPFFLWVQYSDPHPPWAAPQAVRAKHPNDPYGAEIAFMDSQVGRLIRWLDEKKLRDNTLIWIVGDHGFGQGDHDEVSVGYLLYETSLHVPMMLSIPGQKGRASRFTPILSQVDLVPTTLDLLGIPAPSPLDGVSLLKTPPSDRVVFAEAVCGRVMHGWAALSAAFEGSLKLIDGPKPELYDLSADPDERANRATEQPQDATRLREKLAGLFGTELTGEQGPRPNQRFSLESQSALELMGFLVGAGDTAKGDNAHRVSPGDMTATVRRLFESMSAGEGEEADLLRLSALSKAADEQPKFELIHRSLGDLHRGRQEFNRALAEYRKSAELAPGSFIPRYAVVQCLTEQGEKNAAIDALKEMLKDDPGQAEAAYNLGILLVEQQKLEEAVAALRQAYDADPNLPGCGLLLGRTLKKLNRGEEAVSLFRAQGQSHPRSLATLEALVQTLLEQEKSDDAKAALNEALKLDPENDMAATSLAMLLIHSKDDSGISPHEAVRIMERICEKSRYRNPQAMYNLGVAYASAMRVPDAQAILQRARTLAEESGLKQLETQIDSTIENLKKARAVGKSDANVTGK